MDTNACRLFVLSVAQAMDKATDNNTKVLAVGELARADFLHWAWQIKFEAAKNVAHVVDKMLHACGGSGYKRDMELERYLRDAKAGWVMGPTNEVLRQFVGKAVLLGFEALDYWNQSYNRRAVENEVKKLDADGKRELAEKLMPRRPRWEAKAPARHGVATGGPWPSACAQAGRTRSSRRTWVRPGRRDGVRARRGRAGDGASTRDGGQTAEVTVLGAEGRDDAAALGAKADAPATVIARAGGATAASSRTSSARAASTPPRRARCGCSATDRPPGAAQTFRAERAVTVVVAAPGGRIVDGAPPASELLVEVRRATPRGLRASWSCLRRSPSRGSTSGSTARRALALRGARGRVHPGDRRRGQAVLGLPRLPPRASSSGPRARARRDDDAHADGPGVPAARPAREVLRRRHGSAGRGRARHGRPPRHVRARLHGQVLRGHGLPRPRQLHARTSTARSTPFGIAPRKGWEALNFFYNTGFDANNVFVMDEPWSRPGDYVLLRAMSDLVCASSACPDDIDPANGWEITDVHVRVYAPDNRFSMAIAHRVTADADPVLTKETTFHPRTSELTEELRRVPRLLAPALLRQRGRDRRVLGLPREGRRHGPLAAAQVGGARARRRGADPARDHARRAPARGRPGRLHRGLQRDRRDDRRRDGLPARARTTSASSAATSTTASG